MVRLGDLLAGLPALYNESRARIEKPPPGGGFSRTTSELEQ